MDDQYAVTVACDTKQRRTIERRQAPQVEHTRLDAVVRQLLRDV